VQDRGGKDEAALGAHLHIKSLSLVSANGALAAQVFLVKCLPDSVPFDASKHVHKMTDFVPTHDKTAYVICTHKKSQKELKAEAFFELLMTTIFIPAIIARRATDGLPPQARTILLMDGEIAQAQAMARPELQQQLLSAHIDVIKLAAATTSRTQPLDVSKCFVVLKQALRNEHRYGAKQLTRDEERIRQGVDGFLCTFTTRSSAFGGGSALSARKFDALLNFIAQSTTVYSKAFTVGTICSGFRRTGLWPFCAENVLMNCTSWNSLPVAHSNVIRKALLPLAKIAAEHGQVTDKDMRNAIHIPGHAVFGSSAGPLAAAPADGKEASDDTDAIRLPDSWLGDVPKVQIVAPAALSATQQAARKRAKRTEKRKRAEAIQDAADLSPWRRRCTWMTHRDRQAAASQIIQRAVAASTADAQATPVNTEVKKRLFCEYCELHYAGDGLSIRNHYAKKHPERALPANYNDASHWRLPD
jgi:hypothetical protein